MTACPTDPTETEAPSASIPSCALDQTAWQAQYARYRSLANTVSRLERHPEMLTVQFDEHLDNDVLEQTLTVERKCCSFFVFRFDDPERRLTIGVCQPDQAPALDAMATVFVRAQALCLAGEHAAQPVAAVTKLAELEVQH